LRYTMIHGVTTRARRGRKGLSTMASDLEALIEWHRRHGFELVPLSGSTFALMGAPSTPTGKTGGE